MGLRALSLVGRADICTNSVQTLGRGQAQLPGPALPYFPVAPTTTECLSRGERLETEQQEVSLEERSLTSSHVGSALRVARPGYSTSAAQRSRGPLQFGHISAAYHGYAGNAHSSGHVAG